MNQQSPNSQAPLNIHVRALRILKNYRVKFMMKHSNKFAYRVSRNFDRPVKLIYDPKTEKMYYRIKNGRKTFLTQYFPEDLEWFDYAKFSLKNQCDFMDRRKSDQLLRQEFRHLENIRKFRNIYSALVGKLKDKYGVEVESSLTPGTPSSNSRCGETSFNSPDESTNNLETLEEEMFGKQDDMYMEESQEASFHEPGTSALGVIESGNE